MPSNGFQTHFFPFFKKHRRRFVFSGPVIFTKTAVVGRYYTARHAAEKEKKTQKCGGV